MIHLDFQSFDKVNDGILSYKLRHFGITGRLGHTSFSDVRIPGGISQPLPGLCGVPQGTVLDPLQFLIMIIDIDNGISHSSKQVSFTDDPRVLKNVTNSKLILFLFMGSCVNNMFSNAYTFYYVSFNGLITRCGSNVYINPNMEITSPPRNVLGMCIYMSGLIFLDCITLITLFKSIVLSRLDYGPQLWSPFLIKHITQLVKIQWSFTKHITGMHDMSYHERLKSLGLFSLHRRREIYCVIYIGKIVEGLAPNFSNPITSTFSERRVQFLYSRIIFPACQDLTTAWMVEKWRWRSPLMP